MSDCMVLEKEDIQSFCEIDDNCYLLALTNCTDLLVVKDWKMHSRTTVMGDFTLEQSLILPGFDL